MNMFSIAKNESHQGEAGNGRISLVRMLRVELGDGGWRLYGGGQGRPEMLSIVGGDVTRLAGEIETETETGTVTETETQSDRDNNNR